MNNRLGLFSLQGHGYALSLARLLRVAEGCCVYPLPSVPRGVAGMLVEGGELVPLLGSSWLCAALSAAPTAARYQILVASEYGTMGLPADTTLGIVAESRGDWQPDAELRPGFLSDRFFYQGVSYRVVNIDALAVSLIRS